MYGSGNTLWGRVVSSDFVFRFIKICLGYFYPKHVPFLRKATTDFQGDLTDVSAKSATMVVSWQPDCGSVLISK